MKALAKELGVVIPVSFYEAGEGRQLFNSVAVIDADGEAVSYTHLDVYKRQGLWPGRLFKLKYKGAV